MPAEQSLKHPSFREAFRFWLKLGFISFGGPAGQIAIMHAEVVERRRWISEQRFLHALNYCMLLPGPEATQLATYIGWLLHRTRGGVIAGVLFVLPAAILLWLLGFLYVRFGEVPWVEAAFYGLKPAVVAIVAAAVVRIGGRVLHNPCLWTVAVAAFTAIFVFKIPFPVVVLGAALTGLAGSRFRPQWFRAPPAHGRAGSEGEFVVSDTEAPAHTRPAIKRSILVVTVCLLLWWTPVLLAGVCLGWMHTVSREGVFFSKSAMVTFGGAYAVLQYVADYAVQNQWLSISQMTDGLGLAETTPGPLIMVVQFVGFIGAWQNPGELSPLAAATLGAVLTTWCTFVPCFLWIFLGAPHIERLRENQRLNGALTAVSAAVAGVILNLACVFGGHVFLAGDEQRRIDFVAIVISIAAFAALWKQRWSVPVIVLVCAGLGLVVRAAGL